MATNIPEFFSKFANDKKYFLNLPVLWTVTIDGVTAEGINTAIGDSNVWKASTTPGSYTPSTSILVAQEVTLPNESSTFDAHPSGGNTGGFLPGYGMSKRTDFLNRNITVNFLETEQDIDQTFFRPWTIAVGTQGLIEYGPNLKATMIVKQFSNNGLLLKGFRFTKVFPTAIEGYSLNYESTDFKIKSVTFACQNYEQI